MLVTVATNLTLPKAHESSPLRSPRDSDNTNRQWARSNTTNKQLEANMQALNALSRKVEAMRRRILGGNQNQYDVVYIKACLDDGTECYVPVVIDGIIYAQNTGTVTAPEINAGSVPSGEQVLE